MNEQKDLLEQVVCFRIVPENLVPDRTHETRVAMKEASQRFLFSIADASHQDFVCNFSAGCRALDGS
jgi:hypothetical protein